jgi:DNA modification methylase
MNELNRIYNMDCLEGLKLLDDQSVDCCVTSPPYYGLRDYGIDGQIGLEKTPEEYIARLVDVFRELKRALRDDGTLWINIGDSYVSSSTGSTTDACALGGGRSTQNAASNRPSKTGFGVPAKNLIGIPWMLAFALRADGWYLRQDIIWAKPNPMPQSVTDRCTKSHEYIFLFSKSPHYYFDADAIAEPVAESTVKRMNQDIESQHGSERVPGKTNGTMKAVAPRYGGNKYTADPDVFNRTKSGNAYDFHEKRNKRDVWTISTQPFSEAHFATFPPKLIEPCILAGCPVGGVVCDPFMGSGTTAMVAQEWQRNFIGFELNADYIDISEKSRLSAVQLRMV